MCGRTRRTRIAACQRFVGRVCRVPGARRILSKTYLKTVIIVFIAECGDAHLYSGTRTVDIETAKMLVGAALIVAIGSFTLLTVGWTVRDMLIDLRAGRAERARASAAD